MIKPKQPDIPPTATPTVEIPSGVRGREHFIAYLINKNEWKRGAELGVWRGRTFLYLLKNCSTLEKLYGIDLWKPQPNNQGPENWISWDHDKNEKRVREGIVGYEDKVELLKMMTSEAKDYVEDDELDFVFIDADHSTEAVDRDIKEWLPKVKDTGMIIGHDYNWETVREAIYENFNHVEVGPDNLWFTDKT